MAANVFTRDLAIDRVDAHNYTAKVRKTQLFHGFLHGGFAASLMAYTALEHARSTLSRTTEQHIVNLHVDFLRLMTKDDIELHVGHSKIGKNAATLHIVISQGKTPKASGDVNIIDAVPNKGITVDTAYQLHPPPIPVDLAKLDDNADENWVVYRFPLNQSNETIILSHWHICFMSDGPAVPRIHDMWHRLANPEERITTLVLPILADSYLRMVDNWIPNADYSYNGCVRRAKRAVNGAVRQEDLDKAEITTRSATQSLNLEIVRQLPQDGVQWLFLRAEGKVIRNGRLVTEVTVLDEKMEIVAIGSCTDIVQTGSRTRLTRI